MVLGEVEPPGQSPVLSLRSFWRTSSSSHPPLRIGILLDSVKLSRFFAAILEDIQASNFANIELLVFRKVPSPAEGTHPPKSMVSKAARRWMDSNLRKRILYEQYLRFDERKKPANHPLEQVDCSHLLAGIESIEVEPIGKKFVHRFPPDTLETIQAKNLDILLRFGFNILRGDILRAARYGVWSYHHGDNEFYRGGPPHFWELCENAPLSGVVLQVLTEDLDGGLILCKSLYATEATISVSRNRYAAYWGSTDFVIRKLNELHRFGWDYVKENALPAIPYKGKKKIYRTPTNFEMVRWLAPVIIKKAARRVFSPRSTVQHWRIGVRTTGERLFEQKEHGNLQGFRWLEPPPGYFWADPFLIDHGDRRWAFFEEFSYQHRRAHISCAEISPDGSFLSPTRCLVNDRHHYSYPHVFQAEGALFMIPEAADSNSVDLYRCEQFPDRWTLDSTLFRGRFVDTTVWQHDNTWWLATTSAEPDSRSGSLLLLYADSVHGPWRFHPANPISTDVRNVRGAGRVFQSASRLIRPSQNCAGLYGRTLTLNEITELSRLRYAEQTWMTIEPQDSDGVSGIHTYNWCGNVELIDGQNTTSLKRLLPDHTERS